MDKIKAGLQFVIKPWYKARDFVASHPNAALFALIAALAANFRG